MIKIKHLIILTIFTFLSCEDNSLKCDGYNELETVKSILKEHLYENEDSFKNNGINDPIKYVDELFKNNTNFESIRVTDENKDLNSCNCSANMKFTLPPVLKEFVQNEMKEAKVSYYLYGDFELISNRNLTKNIKINYKIQETIDDNTEIEILPSNDDALLAVIKYHLIEKLYNKSK